MKNYRKKILIVIPYLHQGGAERVVSTLTQNFPDEIETDILINSDIDAVYPVKGNVITLGIDKIPQTDSIYFQVVAFIKRNRKLRQLKKNGEYSACISFIDSANISNIISGRHHCKVIVSVRNSLVEQGKLLQYKWIVNPLVRLLYNKADKIVAVSRGVEEELFSCFGINREIITTIENGYDFEKIYELAKAPLSEDEARFYDNSKVIVTVGRLSEQKGQWHLIRAFQDVLKEIPEAKLVIVGMGELYGYLQSLIKGTALEDKVYFTGFVDNPYKYVKRGDIFVLPSMYEGFPNALAEAVCLEKPCIATDFRTGAREILAPELPVQGDSITEIYEAEYGVLTKLCCGIKYESIDIEREKGEIDLGKAIVGMINNNKIRENYINMSRIRSSNLRIEQVVQRWINII